MANKSDFEKIAKILSKDGISEEDFKLLESLLPKIFEAYEKESTEGVSYARLINQHKEKRRMLDSLKDLYDNEAEFAKSENAVNARLARTLRQKLLLNLDRNELTKQEEQHLKDTIKYLEKSITKNKKLIQGFSKGEALTDTLLQATLGISRSWAGEAGFKGIRGAIEGFSKGIKDNLTSTNALATIMSFTVGQLIDLDKARAGLFRTSGFVDITDEFAATSAEYADVFGRQSFEAAAEMYNSAKASIRNRQVVLEGFKSGSFRELGYLQGAGVSMAALTTLYGEQRTALGLSDQESKMSLQRFYKISRNIKRPPEEIFREAAENIPFLSRYGSEFENTFVAMAVTGKETNLAISELVSLGDSLDSLEMGTKTAAKINALLEDKVLDIAEFAIADASEMPAMLGRALAEHERRSGPIAQQTMRSIAGYVGRDAKTVRKLMGAKTDGVVKALEGVDPTKGASEIISDLKSQIDEKQKIENNVAKMGQAFTKRIAQSKTLRFVANTVLDNVEVALIGLVAAVGAYKLAQVGASVIGTPLRPKFIVDMNPAAGLGGPNLSRNAGRGSQFRNQPGRVGSGRSQMFIGNPDHVGPKRNIFQRMASSVKSNVSSTVSFFKNIPGQITSGIEFVKSSATRLGQRMGSGAIGRFFTSMGSGIRSIVAGSREFAQRAALSGADFLRGIKNVITSGPSGMLTSAKTFTNEILKRSTTFLRAAPGHIIKNLVKFGPIAAALESLFTTLDVQTMIQSGFRGPELYGMVGERVFKGLLGVIFGLGAAALAQPILTFFSVASGGAGTVAQVILSVLLYIIGDAFGRWLGGVLSDAIGPKHIQSFGKFVLGMFYDESEISGPNVGAAAKNPSTAQKQFDVVQYFTTSDDKFVEKKMTPEQSPSDPILASLSELIEIIDKNEAGKSEVILEVGFTRIGTVTV